MCAASSWAHCGFPADNPGNHIGEGYDCARNRVYLRNDAHKENDSRDLADLKSVFRPRSVSKKRRRMRGEVRIIWVFHDHRTKAGLCGATLTLRGSLQGQRQTP